MKPLTSLHIISTFLLLSATGVCVANVASFSNQQLQQTPEVKNLADEQKRKIEVISVNNNHSLYYLRKQIQEAELDFYDAFNALADIEKFKIKCRLENQRVRVYKATLATHNTLLMS
jgi:flagellar motility protein MotE (MotC chaperone)